MELQSNPEQLAQQADLWLDQIGDRLPSDGWGSGDMGLGTAIGAVLAANGPIPPTIVIRSLFDKYVTSKLRPSKVNDPSKQLQIIALSAEIEMKNEAQKPEVRMRLCAALEHGTKDTFELAKVLLPVIATLALSGTIAIPPIPIAIAVASLVISRMGVAALCADGDEESGNKDE